MADARMLRKKISEDVQVAQLTAHSALLYVLSIPHLDVDGRMNGLPAHVRGTVVPEIAQARPQDWTDQLVAAYMLEWTSTLDDTGDIDPLVLWYAAEGKSVCFFTGFASNQKLRRDRESPSRLPAPPPALLDQPAVASARLAELAQLRSNSGADPGQEVRRGKDLSTGLSVARARGASDEPQGQQIAQSVKSSLDSVAKLTPIHGFGETVAGGTLTPDDFALAHIAEDLRGADRGTLHLLKSWRRKGCREREFAIARESLANRRRGGLWTKNEARYFCSELKRLLAEKEAQVA